MGHTESHDEAVRAFDNGVDCTDRAETVVMLAIAQYHATMATYELSLEIGIQLKELAGVFAAGSNDHGDRADQTRR